MPRSRMTRWLATGVIACLLGPLATAQSWRDDAIWDDGKAEYAVYDASRPIYGEPRQYEAVIITNKQHMDPRTTTKASDWQDRRAFVVFKHNTREVAPTPNYEYKYLTTAFIRAEDLSPYKLTMSSQEDCGASFKNAVVDGGRVEVDSFVYFPDAGHVEERYSAPRDFQFYDALTLTLRNYPFDEPRDVTLRLLPEQTDTHSTPLKPSKATVRYAGRETLELPIGNVAAHHLVVSLPDGKQSDYWFADDAEHPDWLRILVRYHGFDGVRFHLKSRERWAYWER